MATPSFRSIDDTPEFETLLFAYRDTKFITGQMRDVIAFANDRLESAVKAHVKRIRQLERELAAATSAPAENQAGALAPNERAKFEVWYAKRHPGPVHKNPTWAHAAKCDDWEVWQARAMLDQTAPASAETASSALHACISFVVHDDADFSGMDEALVSYFKEQVRKVKEPAVYVQRSLNDNGLVATYLYEGWTFEYEPETRFVAMNHPRGGKQSICEVQNADKFGYAIAALLNEAIYMTAKDVQPTDTWRVGEFWSSGSPGTKVLMLSRGAEIASHEKHESFVRWVGASSIHTRASETAA